MACVLEAGEGGGALQCLAQRIDALGGVGADKATARNGSHAAERVAFQAANAVTERRR